MKNTYWNKRKEKAAQMEEQMLLGAVIKPGESVMCKGHILRVSYPEVRDGVLVYMVNSRTRSYWISEQELLGSNQI